MNPVADYDHSTLGRCQFHANFAQFRAWPRSYVVRRWFNAALHRAVVRVTTVGA